MFGQSRNRNADSAQGESRQPLLGGRDPPTDERTIFSVDDSDDDDELLGGGRSALATPKNARPDHSVRFEENVQVIAPSLRSTTSSREAGAYVSVTSQRLIPQSLSQNLS